LEGLITDGYRGGQRGQWADDEEAKEAEEERHGYTWKKTDAVPYP
jgi:hypothetical protein